MAFVNDSFLKLKDYCEKEDFKGWDPYDGLNSRIFQATPLKYWSFARLAWIQLFKRNPINLRKLLMVPKGYNPKGVGLFLTGYCNLYKIAEKGNTEYGTKEEILDKIRYLVNLLIDLKSEGYSGACWGYNFDWQARGGLFFPAGTPNVVTTTYAASGLLDAWEILKDNKIKETAVSSAEFVINDLNRTEKEEGFLFSYAPIFGNNTVYNASLMGSRLLARIYNLTGNEEYKTAARSSVLACCNAQCEDGSWLYGELDIQNWIDSFHTGFNLEAIYDYAKYTNDNSFNRNFDKGFEYYINNFFLNDGTPKYYHNKTYPIDIHSPAQLLVTISKCGKYAKYKDIASEVLKWTVNNMQSEMGFFYYQKNAYYTIKIPYIRWSQAWMFYGSTEVIKRINERN